MKRADLEHLIRASADIAADDEVVVIGSQAILGQFPDAPAELLVSVEADVYPKNHPERWELIDGSIGELSPFHKTFGYYARGVEPGTAVVPQGWEAAISKYVAGRTKDREFLRAAVQHRMLHRATLTERLAATTVPDELRALIRAFIEADFRNTPS